MKRFDASYACVISVHINTRGGRRCAGTRRWAAPMTSVNRWIVRLMDRRWYENMKKGREEAKGYELVKSFHGGRWDETRRGGNGNRIAKICTKKAFCCEKNIELLYSQNLSTFFLKVNPICRTCFWDEK